MKRFCFLAVLMLLSPSAYADSFSFSVGGHRIHIESSRHCRSTSCASVSISGLYQSRRKRDRHDDDNRDEPVQTTPPASPAVSSVPAAPPATKPVQQVAPPPAVFKPAAAVTQPVAVPPPAPVQPATTTPPPPVQPAKVAPPPPLPPAEAIRPAPASIPRISRVSQEVDDEPADTPIGDWQTEGKGTIRIARCGNALCGYALNASSDEKGEAILINMKPKTDQRWTGNVYSHDSGDTYYGTIDMKSPNTLRVEACALGRFYCSGNVWSRIVGKAESLITSRQVFAEPRS